MSGLAVVLSVLVGVDFDLHLVLLLREEAGYAAGAHLVGLDDAHAGTVLGAYALEQFLDVGALKQQPRGQALTIPTVSMITEPPTSP